MQETRRTSAILVGILTLAVIGFSCLTVQHRTWAQESPPDIEFDLPEEFADFGEDSDFGVAAMSEEEEATANTIRNGVVIGGGCIVALAAAMILRKKKRKTAA